MHAGKPLQALLAAALVGGIAQARAWGGRGKARLGAMAVALTPVAYGDIVSQIENAVIGFFQTIWDGIVSFFGQISNAIVSIPVTAFTDAANVLGQSFTSLGTWANTFGPLSPLIVAGIVSMVVLIIVFVLWLVIKLSVSEGEQTAEEAEEGV